MADKIPFSERLQHGFNAFRNKDPSILNNQSRFVVDSLASSSTFRPDRKKMSFSLDPTFINSILTRLGVDAASATFEHMRTDENGGYLETIDSGLNRIFNLEANIDQTGQAFMLDVVLTMFEEGVVCCVPVDTLVDPIDGITVYDIETMRCGKITNWWPDKVAVELYNDELGVKQTITFLKRDVAIIENPFYNIMNEPNSTLRRLNRRLALLDIADENATSSKLDMLIQLPYVIKSSTRESQAKKRRDEIVSQLNDSEYGIAYIDGTEKIVQLNRPIENNMLSKIEYLTNLLFNQLGLTPEIINMTADEQTMTNYYKRMIDPIDDAIVKEFKRKFLTKTARTQRQTIWYHSEPFTFTPTSSLAEIADKMIRNEILTANEFRGVIGYKPSDDPRANELRNPNIPQAEELPTSNEQYYEDGSDVGIPLGERKVSSL